MDGAHRRHRARRSSRLDGVRASNRRLPDVALEGGDSRTRPNSAALRRGRTVVDSKLPGNRRLLKRRVLPANDAGGVAARDDEPCLVVADDELAEEGIRL